LLSDRGFDVDEFRKDIKGKWIKPCILCGKLRVRLIMQDNRRSTRCNWIEVMVGYLKDWPRGATRYDSLPRVFLFAVALRATLMVWP
jgi:hypothetical protein